MSTLRFAPVLRVFRLLRQPFLWKLALWLTCAGNCFAELPAFMQKPSPQHIRIVSYNVNWDSIFENGDPDNDRFRCCDRSDEFVRVVAALNPDILCLQEINWDRDSQDVGDILDAALPLSGGQTWRTHRGSDNVIASRFDLLMQRTDTIPGTNRGMAMALVDLPSEYAADIYVMNAHFKCCGGATNIQRRQQHADAIINWIRDIKEAGGNIDLPVDTPIVTLGDLNVIDNPASYVNTLITGDINNEVTYGTDAAPDWDGTNQTDLLPLHNGAGSDSYSWRDDSGPYAPGALDRIVFTDSVVSVGNSFILNTAAMTAADLTAAGLQSGDVLLYPDVGNYDHLPLVVDFLVTTIETPSAPSDLQCVVNGCNSVDLSWSDNSDNETEFEISIEPDCSDYDLTEYTGPNESNATISDLIPCVTACFSVRAKNASGVSSRSSQVSCTPDCGPLPCAADSQCGDDDACTTDTCVSGCCSNTPITPCCGNASCEPEETFDNCATDCEQQEPVQTTPESVTIVVGPLGDAVAEAVATDGAARGIVEVTRGTTGKEIVVELLVNDGPPGIDGAATLNGFGQDRALGVTLKVTTTMNPDTFTAVVRLTVAESELAKISLDFAEAHLYVLDQESSPPIWRPAGNNFVGRSSATGTPGDYGYEPNDDETVTYWSVRKRFSVFAIGQTTVSATEPSLDDEPTPDPDPEPEPEAELENDDSEAPVNQPAPDSPTIAADAGPCGALGIVSWGMMMVGLLPMRRRPRVGA